MLDGSAEQSAKFDISLIENYWHLAAHKSELSEFQSYVKLTTAKSDVVIYNDYGDIIVFDNKCPHRGANFITEKAGCNKLVCPYHAWTYQKGKLHIPRQKEFTNCDVSQAKLNNFNIAYCGDFIFFSEKPLSSLNDQLGDFFNEMLEISLQISARYEFDNYLFACDWKIAVENALEPYHINMIHQETLAKLKLGAGENTFSGVNSKWIAPVNNISKGTERLLKLFNTGDRGRNYEFFYLFPFSMLSGTYGLSWSLQNFFPKDASSNYFNSRLFGVRPKGELDESIMQSLYASIAQMNKKVFEEDHAVCSGISAKTWSASAPTYYSDVEIKMIRFREICKSVICNL